MSGPELVEVRLQGRVAVISFGRPRLNLLTSELYRELRAHLKRLAEAEDLGAVVIHGAGGRSFSAGSDIHELAALGSESAERKVMLENLALHDLEAFPAPTLAAIEGYALGGGFELALACDLRVLADDAVVGLPEATLGGVASSGARRLVRLVGPSGAKQLLFLGDQIDSRTALGLGLVNWTADPGTALDRAQAIAHAIGTRSRLSNRLAKRLVDGVSGDGFLDSVRAQEQVFEGPDLPEGVAAFQERRKPRFASPDAAAETAVHGG